MNTTSKAGLSLRAGDRRFPPATMSMTSSCFYRKQKEKRAKRTFHLFLKSNSPPTNCIYSATQNLSDSPAKLTKLLEGHLPNSIKYLIQGNF